MALYSLSACKFCAISLLLLTCVSQTISITDDTVESRVSSGRHLLQAKKACPVNFEFLNYTIILSQCKGPHYAPTACCGALKVFACPYADYLNDLTNDCATTMFSYINLYGKYPPGLFASECRDSKRGLECSALPPSTLSNGSESPSTSNVSETQTTSIAPLLLMLTAGFVVLIFQVL